jgi:AraC-like DNA-binding protein/5-methylcytosine-specific restriction endonuclease McrA
MFAPMDRAWLHEQLAAGRSIESLARELGRDPSTVAYWVAKHGLASTHAPKHAARGGIAREALVELLAEGLSLRAMAARLGMSYTTVRHWMGRHGLSTARGQRLADTAGARAAGLAEAQGTCPVHGEVTLIRRGADGFRCPFCRREAVAVRRRRIKAILVEESGGACSRCGYCASVAALHFHHIDPANKSFALARGGSRALDAARQETQKCVLLCANCHAEVEARGLPGR